MRETGWDNNNSNKHRVRIVNRIRSRRGALLQKNYEYFSIGMVTITGGVLRVLHGVLGQIVGHGFYFVGFLQAAADVVALAVDGWIDLVGHAAVALIFSETDVVSSGATPHLL